MTSSASVKSAQFLDWDSDLCACKTLQLEFETQTITASSHLASLLRQPSIEASCMLEDMLWAVSIKARELLFSWVP